MPSPRAVLADITDFKLDPTVAHTTIHGTGRLAKPAGHQPVVKVEEHKKPEPKPEPKKVEAATPSPPPLPAPEPPKAVEVKAPVEETKAAVVEEKTVEKVAEHAETEETAKKRGGKKAAEKA
jgi:outer membrane biosynthesis protein TonB